MRIREALDESIEFYRMSKYEEAINGFNSILAEHPENPDAHNLLGVILGAVGQPDEAIEHIRKAIEIKDDTPAFHYNLGQIYKLQYRLDEAMDSLKQSLEIREDYFPALKDMSIICRYKGDDKYAFAYGKKAVEYFPDNPDAHNILGEVYEKTGDLGKAEECYRTSIRIDSNFYPPYSNLGNIKHNLAKLGEAQELFEKSLLLNPDQPIIKHELASIIGETPDRPDDKFVISLFNHYADNFDEHMKVLSYKVPEVIYKAVCGLLGDSIKDLRILDLGCGTGKCGELFKDNSSYIIGVDLSPKMIERAGSQNIYDELFLGDIIDSMRQQEESCDLILAADTFIYVGALESTFKEVAKCLKEGGLLAFSIEEEDGDGFSLAPTGRYKHSRQYITSLAKEHGFEVVHDEETGIRIQIDKPIVGCVMVLRKS